MTWVDSRSPAFAARHEAADTHHVEDLLDDLETFRSELGELFERVPDEISVIVHSHSLALDVAQPWLPVARVAAAPAARRYLASWFSSRELHVLSPGAIERRASEVPGSRAALLLSPLNAYARLVIGVNNDALPPPFTPASFARYLRWAWIPEGAAAHLAGQTRYLRPAIARRLRDGPTPAFPPAARDAPLLAGTLFALLERQHGRAACARLAASAGPGGHARSIERAFDRPARSIERMWRDLLSSLSASPASNIEATSGSAGV